MAKRWLNSADVEISEAGAILTQTAGCKSLGGGTKLVTPATTAQRLVTAATPCQFVWVGARITADGTPQNSSPCFIGDSAGQNIPVMPSNYEGIVIRTDDANKVFVKVGVNNEGVAYRIFG